MSDKELQAKAISIKGKDYILVKDRLAYLAENFEDYCIETEYNYMEKLNMFIVKATLTLNGRVFTGHSQAVIGQGNINTTSALENCESSAVGRACAMAGIGIIDSIASADEMVKAAGFNVKHDKPVGNNQVHCKTCNKVMEWKVWTAKTGDNAGKLVGAYQCPDKVMGDNTKHKMQFYEVINEEISPEEFEG